MKDDQATFEITLKSDEREPLSEMFSVLGNRSLLFNHAQAFDQQPLANVNSKEENFFLIVKLVPRSSLLKSAKIIGSHTVYILKINEN